MKKKFTILSILLTISILILGSLSVFSVNEDIVKARMRLGEDVITLDPAHTIREYDIQLVLFSRLVKYKPGSSELVNDVAEKIELSEDGKIIYFELKKGIQFHKGYGEMTAEDVKFSFERIIDPEENSEYKGDWKTLDHVNVTGKYTGEIVLNKPLASLFATTLPFTPGSIISKKAYEELAEKFATHPVGSGPYYWKEWKPEQKLILERFDDYFGEKPDFKQIELYPILDKKVAEMSFDKGELNVTEIALDSIDRYMDNPEVDVHVLTALKYTFIGFNHEYAPFDNILVRQAIKHAIDADMIIIGAYNGVPKRAKTMIAPGILGHWENAPEYEVDLEKAKELLTKAGYPDGFETTMSIASDPVSQNVAQIVKHCLSKINVEVNIHVVEAGSTYQYFGKESHPGIHYYAFSLNLDPGYWVAWFIGSQVGKWNFIKWANAEYDQLATEAALEMDQEKRANMYIRMQKIMDEDAAIIWLTNGAKVYVSDKNVEPTFLGHYNQYRYWNKE
jgi:peptide/nickel transport system substrate-binding protein